MSRPLEVAHTPLIFSYWPVAKRAERFLPGVVLHTAAPWTVIRSSLSDIADPARREDAIGFIRQGEDLFRAARESSALGAQPMLYYYAFLNLAKAFIIKNTQLDLSVRFTHGLEPAPVDGVAYHASFKGPQLSVKASNKGSHSVFSHLVELFSAQPPPPSVALEDVAAQCIVGHAMLCSAWGIPERFRPLSAVQMLMDRRNSGDHWTALANVFVASSLHEVNQDKDWHLKYGLQHPWGRSMPVYGTRVDDGQHITLATATRAFGQVEETDDSVSAAAARIVAALRPVTSRTMSRSPPFRQYYVFESDSGARRLPDLVTCYAIMFYLGSLSRYSPKKFAELMKGAEGLFAGEFLAAAPANMLYEFASEFSGQEVAEPG